MLPPKEPVTVESDASLIGDAHLFLLDQFGRSIGFAFFPNEGLEPPSTGRVTVFGRFDPRARKREFGLELATEKHPDGSANRVARLIDLYLPEKRRRQGHGTRLMDGLVELWEAIGVTEVQLKATGDGYPAYLSWGFVADGSGGGGGPLPSMRLLLPRSAPHKPQARQRGG
jgi:GNAT superfamily N-acetyltransferase